MNADDPSVLSGTNDPEIAETTQSGLPQPLLFHYTDEGGYKSISSQINWGFQAFQPPGNHPFGAYFTLLTPDIPNLSKRLRIPRTKTEYVFCFRDAGDLKPIRGGRGRFVVYSAKDYVVTSDRQVFHGLRADWIGNRND